MRVLFILFIILVSFSDVFSAKTFTCPKPMEQITLIPEGLELFKPRPGFRKQRFGYNTIFVESGMIFGNYEGMKYSINYDLVAQNGDFTALTLRIGYEIVKATHFQKNNIPVFVNLLIGKKNHLELSGGVFYDLNNNKMNPAFQIGFRHHNPKGGFFYRINAFISNENEYNDTGLELHRIWIMGPAASLGWSF